MAESGEDSDRFREGYQRWYAEHEPPWEPFIPALNAASPERRDVAAKLLRNETGGVLIDLGCGAGQFPLAMGTQFDHVGGMDYTSTRIELAERSAKEHYPELAGRTDFRAGRIDEPLPYETASADAVTLIAVLDHIVDIYSLMDELARVVKPGGALVLTIRNATYLKDQVDGLRGRLPSTWQSPGDPHAADKWREIGGWQGGVVHQFNKPSLERLLEVSGFTAEEWLPFGRQGRRLRRWPNLVSGLAVRGRRR